MCEYAITVVRQIPLGRPVSIRLQPRPEIDFPYEFPLSLHKVVIVCLVQFVEFQDRFLITYEKPTAESPVDAFRDMCNKRPVKFIPATWYGEKLAVEFAITELSQIFERSRFVAEDM